MAVRSWLTWLVLLGALAGCGDDDAGAEPVADAGSRDAASGSDDGGLGLDARLGGDDAEVSGDAAASGDDGSSPLVDAEPTDGGLPPTSDSGVALPAPDQVGPYSVTRSSVMIADATAVVFAPALPDGARAPLVVLKHGFQLATSNYAALAERVASHGFVVVGVDTAGGLFGGPSNIDERDATIGAIGWATSESLFAASLDATRIAVIGHSRGGKVATLVAASDARVTAALLLDPINGCGPGMGFSADCPDATAAGVAGALTIPVGVMGETNNGSGGFMPCAPVDQNYQTFASALSASSWTVAWTFSGADHMDFTDDGGGLAGSFCPDGPGDDMQIRDAVHTLAVAFVRRHLLGETAMDGWLVGASLPAGIVPSGP